MTATAVSRRRPSPVARAPVPRDDAAGMRALLVIGLSILFVLGAVLGLAIGVVVFVVSWFRATRAVHARGVVCRGELSVDPPLGHLAGPALVRMSGALEDQAAASDVLGICVRIQRTASNDPADGDQDLLFGSFASFLTASRDRGRTNAGDYLANRYWTVAPWWLARHGPVILRLLPPPPAAVDRGVDRLARLDADLAADRARFALAIARPAGDVRIGELRLVERLVIDDRPLRASMFRHGRGVRPLGLQNGIRATAYPMSQLARRLRGG